MAQSVQTPGQREAPSPSPIHARRELLAEGERRILKMIVRNDALMDILSAIIHLAEQAEPGSIAGVTLVEKAEKLLDKAVFPSVDPEFSAALAGVPLDSANFGTQALSQGIVVTSENIELDVRLAPRWRELCRIHGIASCQTHPVRGAAGTLLGAFLLCFPEPRKAASFDGRLIALCTELVQLAIDHLRAAERQELVIRELQHRIQNLFAAVGALARFTFDGNRSLKEMRDIFSGRLRALGAAHNLIVAKGSVLLDSLIRRALQPYGGNGGRVTLAGPPVRLGANAASSLSMAIHELATNASKYGALTCATGCIQLTWKFESQNDRSELVLEWEESGGPPVTAPKRRGFGTRAIERLLARDIEGEATIDFAPEGLRCTIRAPLSGHISPA